MIDDVRLAVTEACTNVVRHAYEQGEGTDRRRRPAPRATRSRSSSRTRAAGSGPSPDTAGARARPAAHLCARRHARDRARPRRRQPAGHDASSLRTRRPWVRRDAGPRRRRASRSPPARWSARCCAGSSACSPRAPTCRSTGSTTPCWSPTSSPRGRRRTSPRRRSTSSSPRAARARPARRPAPRGRRPRARRRRRRARRRQRDRAARRRARGRDRGRRGVPLRPARLRRHPD